MTREDRGRPKACPQRWSGVERDLGESLVADMGLTPETVAKKTLRRREREWFVVSKTVGIGGSNQKAAWLHWPCGFHARFEKSLMGRGREDSSSERPETGSGEDEKLARVAKSR